MSNHQNDSLNNYYTYYCEYCGQDQIFSPRHKDHVWLCTVCENEVVVQNRDHRRNDNVKKHTWEPEWKKR